MARYIDADKLIEKYERVIKDPWNKSSAPSSWASAWECVIADIDDIPTADVVPKSEVEKFAEDIKLEFYREFDEIIPSIMADKIEELKKKYTEGNQ